MNVTRFKFGEQKAICESYKKVVNEEYIENNDTFSDQMKTIFNGDNWRALWDTATGKYGSDAAKQLGKDTFDTAAGRTGKLITNTAKGIGNMVTNPSETFSDAGSGIAQKTMNALQGGADVIRHPVKTWNKIKENPSEFFNNAVPFAKLASEEGMDDYSLADMVGDVASVVSVKGVKVPGTKSFTVGGNIGKTAKGVADTARSVADISKATGVGGKAAAVGKTALNAGLTTMDAEFAAAPAGAAIEKAKQDDFNDMNDIHARLINGEDVSDEEAEKYEAWVEKTFHDDEDEEIEDDEDIENEEEDTEEIEDDNEDGEDIESEEFSDEDAFNAINSIPDDEEFDDDSEDIELTTVDSEDIESNGDIDITLDDEDDDFEEDEEFDDETIKAILQAHGITED